MSCAFDSGLSSHAQSLWGLWSVPMSDRQYCLDKAADCERKAAQARHPDAAKEFQSHCRKVARGSGNARFQPESRRHSADLSSGRISEFITLLGGATAICALYGLKLIGDRSTKVVVAVGTWLMIACPWPGRQRNRLASIKSGARRSAGYPSGLGQVRVSRPSAWRPARPLLPRADMVREIAAVGQGCPRGKVRPRTSAATSSPDSTPRRAN